MRPPWRRAGRRRSPSAGPGTRPAIVVRGSRRREGAVRPPRSFTFRSVVLARAVGDLAAAREAAVVERVAPVVATGVVVVELIRGRRRRIGRVGVGRVPGDAEHRGEVPDPRAVGGRRLGVVVETGEVGRELARPDTVEGALRRVPERHGALAGVMCTRDRGERAVQVVAGHEVARAVLRRRDDERAVLVVMRPDLGAVATRVLTIREAKRVRLADRVLAGRAGGTLRALRTGVALRAGGAGVALRALRTCRAGVALCAGRAGVALRALRACSAGGAVLSLRALGTRGAVVPVATAQRVPRRLRQVVRTQRAVLDVEARHRAVLDVGARDEHLLRRESAGRDRKDHGDEAAGGENLLQLLPLSEIDLHHRPVAAGQSTHLYRFAIRVYRTPGEAS